jgi:hypothetical protein
MSLAETDVYFGISDEEKPIYDKEVFYFGNHLRFYSDNSLAYSPEEGKWFAFETEAEFGIFCTDMEVI